MADLVTRVLKVNDIDMIDSAIWKEQGARHLLSEWSRVLGIILDARPEAQPPAFPHFRSWE